VVIYVPRCVQNGSGSLGLEALEDFVAGIKGYQLNLCNNPKVTWPATHKHTHMRVRALLPAGFAWSTCEDSITDVIVVVASITFPYLLLADEL
jgi:hypothetical protein